MSMIFQVDYDIIDVNVILNIHKYFIKKAPYKIIFIFIKKN